MSNEFEIIKQYFYPIAQFGDQDQFLVGQGDDCAVIRPQSRAMAISIDTQVSGIHFLDTMAPEIIAQRGLGAALSDLAAMGAQPSFFTLALSLPKSLTDDWIEKYAKSLAQIAQQWNISLIGGDTTSSTQLIQTFQVHGYLDSSPLKRSGANQDDFIFVTGNLGDAALATEYILQQRPVPKAIASAYNQPTPRFDIAKIITEFATSCIDISDGLLADLGHICDSSNCGAEIYLDKIPTSEAFKLLVSDKRHAYALSATGGDDYQLCFTLSPDNYAKYENQLNKLDVTKIGKITSNHTITCYNDLQETIRFDHTGFNHRT